MLTLEDHRYYCEQLIAEVRDSGQLMAVAMVLMGLYLREQRVPLPEDPFAFATRGHFTIADAKAYDLQRATVH